MADVFPRDVWVYILNYAHESLPRILSTCRTLASLSVRIRVPLWVLARPPTVREMFQWLRRNHTHKFQSVAPMRWTMDDLEIVQPFIIRTTDERRIKIYRQGSRRKLWVRGRSRGRIFLCSQTVPIYLDLIHSRGIHYYSEFELIFATIEYQYPLACALWIGPRSKILYGLMNLAKLHPDLSQLTAKLTVDYRDADNQMMSDHEDSDTDSVTGVDYRYVRNGSEIISYEFSL